MIEIIRKGVGFRAARKGATGVGYIRMGNPVLSIDLLNPKETMFSAIGGCAFLTLQPIAKRKGIDLVSIYVNGHLGDEKEYVSIKVNVRGEINEKMIINTVKTCPLVKLVGRACEVKVEVYHEREKETNY
jgi:uncharacterized OsmC-like protein